MSSSLKQHITSMVQELIPLGVPRQQRTDGTSYPASSRPRLDPPGKTPKLSSSQPKPILPVKTPKLQRRESVLNVSKVSSKSSKTGLDSLWNCNVVMRKLQTNNGNINTSKDVSFSPVIKKKVQRTSSYEKTRDLSIALSKELNENLRVSGRLLPSKVDVKSRRHTLPQPSHSKPNSSNLVPERPKSSVSTVERIHHRPDRSKDRRENRNLKPTSLYNMSSQKELSPPHGKSSPEGSLYLSAKRKRESSTDSEKDNKRPCVTPSSSGINSPPKFVRRVFMNSTTEPVITLKDKLLFEPLSQTSDSNKSRPLSSIPKQLFKPETSGKSNTESDKTHSFQHIKSPTAGEPKDAMVARANKNPKAPPSQPHLRKTSPKSSTTFDSIVDFFAPDLYLPSPKTHIKNSNGEREVCAASTRTSSLPSHKESVKICLSPHRPDLRTANFAGHAGTCTMEWDESKQLKGEQSCSPKANMPVPAVSVKAEGSSEKKHCPQWKDPLDYELGDDLDDDLCCAITLSSSSSSGDEEEQLPSLRKIMERSVCQPVTPEKEAFSEPSTPVPKAAPEAVKTKAVSYRNTLEQMLLEKQQYQRSKELERQLLESCQEDLLNFNEDRNSEAKEEDISHQQREFLKKFSVASCAIRDIHPGEEVFTPAKFGRLFNHQTLDLRKINVTPHNRSQQMLIQSDTDQVMFLISAGLLRSAYIYFPCQPEVTRWLFQMMSVHPDPINSSLILESLRSIALSAAEHIVENQVESQRFKVWVPTVQDIALVFLNMGASFISLFPLEALQPSFTEGDLLEEFQPKETTHETLIPDKDSDTLAVHNFENVLKYLSLCTALCPRAYTDDELLLLSTVVCRIALEIHFQLLPTAHFTLLLHNLLKNITHWDVQISKACQTLADLSEDHHNLRRLVYLLPDSSRGKQLKQHLSVSIISKLLNHHCTYKPSDVEFKLSVLKSYLPQMRPSSLLKALRSSRSSEDCNATIDQQAYYLCYSLLTLLNEASNFEFLPSNQRNELRSLSSQLEKHIKCDIRESEKTLYRSKVKDFVARIYTKWQVLLVRTRPQEGKLYDFWKPPPEDEIPNSPRGKICLNPQNTSESTGETRTGELSGAESEDDDDDESEEEREEDKSAKEHENPQGSEEKTSEGNVDSVENCSEVGEESDEEKQQLMELNDQFRSFAEELTVSDEDEYLMTRKELLSEDEEPHEDRQHTEENDKELEELMNWLGNGSYAFKGKQIKDEV